MIYLHHGFIERNESGEIRERVLEGIEEIEKEHELNKLSIDEIVEKIAEIDILEDSLVSILGVISIPYVYFKHLCKTASVEKLEELTNHPNFVVQCYAFVALTQKAPDKIFKIIMSKLHITKRIKTMGFDIMSRIRVADFFIYEGIPFLSNEQYNDITNKVLKNNYNLQFKQQCFLDLIPEEKNYEIVKKFAVEFKNSDALVTLAKYQKESDVDVIKSFSQEESWQFYEAIKNFPHPTFWNLLRIIHDRGMGRKGTYPPNLRSLYACIAVYHNTEALDVLTNTFDRIETRNFVKYHAEAIFKAVRTYKDGFYDQLLFTLWKDYNQINLEIFDYLMEKIPDPCFDAIKLSLNNPDKFYDIISNSYNFNDFINDPEKLTLNMIKIYIAKDKNGAYKSIIKNILVQNVNYLPIFTKFSSKISEEEFIKPLFQRFTNDKNHYVYCEIARCLLEYNSTEINSRILKIFRKKSYLSKNIELREILNKAGVIPRRRKKHNS